MTVPLGNIFAPEPPLEGLHVSRAGDFYWPNGDGLPNKYPPTAPDLSVAQVNERVRTDEIRAVRA